MHSGKEQHEPPPDVATSASPAVPLPLTSFVGRERELEHVKHLLARTRLLTLTGPGGVGKTRLALALARDFDGTSTFPDGVRVVGLASLADAALVSQTTAAALGVREEPGRAILATLQDALRPRRLLLVLDNCEHLVEACAQLADTLLQACPRLTILATSRESLNIAGEAAWPVPPLAVPQRGDTLAVADLLRCEAIRLFVERAETASPGFALTDRNAVAVAEICTRLDGLPLAIELAAARARLLAPEQIATRLSDRFGLLTGGSRTALPRHQTVRALVDWSYELLPEPERTVFCQLGTFGGDWSLTAAEAVCGGDGIEPNTVLELLGHLVDRSLVVAQPPASSGREFRYRLLETLRHYALERLTADDTLAATARRHASYFLDCVARANARLWAGDEAGAMGTIELEHDNVRIALRHFLASGAAECAARLAGELGMFWFFSGYFGEGRAWLREVLGQTGLTDTSASTSAAYANALHADGRLAHAAGDYLAAEQRLHAALAMWRRLGNRVQIANALFLLGRTKLLRGERAAARPLFLESLASAAAAGDRWVESLPRLWLAQVAFDDGDDEAAQAWAERVLADVATASSSRNASFALRLLGDVEARRGNGEHARELLEASLARGREVGPWLAAWPAINLADLLTAQHDHARARPLLREALITYRDAGDRQGVARSLEGCAWLAASGGVAVQAVRLAGAAAALRAAADAPLSPSERLALDRFLPAARAALRTRAADVAWAEGHSLPAAQATAEALVLLDSPGREASPGPIQRTDPLTPREREVASLVARGLSNRAIAGTLVITEATVERHIGNVFTKLALTSRAQLAVWAHARGLVQGNP